MGASHPRRCEGSSSFWYLLPPRAFFHVQHRKNFFFFQISLQSSKFLCGFNIHTQLWLTLSLLDLLAPSPLKPSPPQNFTCTCIANVFYYPPHLSPLEVISPSLGPLSRFLWPTVVIWRSTQNPVAAGPRTQKWPKQQCKPEHYHCSKWQHRTPRLVWSWLQHSPRTLK